MVRSTLYLDTQVVIWLHVAGEKKLSQAARRAIDASEDLRISPMVEMELGLLEEIGHCRRPPEAIIGHLHQTLGLIVCDLAWREIIPHARRFTWTRDPFDRLITAHAACAAAPLVTADAHIHEHYPHALW